MKNIRYKILKIKYIIQKYEMKNIFSMHYYAYILHRIIRMEQSRINSVLNHRRFYILLIDNVARAS